MGVHPDRMVLADHLAELVGHAVRVGHEHPCAEADDLDVIDLPQARENVLQSGVAQERADRRLRSSTSRIWGVLRMYSIARSIAGRGIPPSFEPTSRRRVQ